LCFYLQRGTSERSSTSLRLFLPICLMYYYSLQIKNGIKKGIVMELLRSCLLAELLPSNGCCIFVYSAVVA
jgi:hypothetical protein